MFKCVWDISISQLAMLIAASALLYVLDGPQPVSLHPSLSVLLTCLRWSRLASLWQSRLPAIYCDWWQHIYNEIQSEPCGTAIFVHPQSSLQCIDFLLLSAHIISVHSALLLLQEFFFFLLDFIFRPPWVVGTFFGFLSFSGSGPGLGFQRSLSLRRSCMRLCVFRLNSKRNLLIWLEWVCVCYPQGSGVRDGGQKK